MEFKDRLKKARKARKVSQVRLAEMTGLDQTTISNLETGKVQSTSKVVQIAHELQVSSRWLATGEGDMEDNVAEFRSKQAPKGDELEMLDTIVTEGDEPLRPDEVMLPVFREVEFSAGSGSTQVIENHGAQERFSLPRLSRAGVQPENAALAIAKGDSMEDTILDGATLGIDKGTRHVIDGKIYALDHGGMLRVKRLYRMPIDRIRLSSDNSDEYPDEVYHVHSEEAPRIIGRVFWWENFD
ncbi:helix-turn-helix transcriptional regulator [Halomonas sp. I1]|uniref:XRE family transcriptional regulator n=1 Tax=Halomonas sp. I1 TaxID=393536 RepID=UPI0028DD7AC1|nr:helix-turn-helix transcriptional regulator [Halomonas sp. I1]MDT8895665.1 helix-turn-helix transcriptional regulator [Halomonas sp. I1]